MSTRYFCAMPNIKDGKSFPQIYVDDGPDADKIIATFIEKHDRPGFAVYKCVNPLVHGARRRGLDTIDAVHEVAIDLDFKDVDETPEEVDEGLLHLRVPPTEVRNSGGGRHIVWKLKEPIYATDQEDYARACALIKDLTARLCGDPAPAHPAALLRARGTLNSKRAGAPVLVEPLWGSSRPVDITELGDQRDDLPEGGLFTRKPKGNGERRGGNHEPRAPGEWKPKVDVDQRLADVAYKGPGNSGVHVTELSVTSSLLCSGMSVESAVLTVLEDLKGKNTTAGWDWDREEHVLRQQCIDWVNKHPELSSALSDELRIPFEAFLSEGGKPGICFRKDTQRWSVKRLRESDKKEGPEPDSSEPQARGAEHPYRFKLVSFCDLRPGPEPLYLVDELIPIAGLVDVWGKAKCYKSFWVLDLMLHVTMGWEYRDRAVRQGAVVYCAFEGAHGYKKRVEALRRHYAIQEDTHVPLYVMPGQANLILEHKLLIADIPAQMGETRPVAVVLDTLNKSLFGSENKDVDMGAYVRAAEAIRDKFNCVVIIVHHCGYDETRPRGHSSLPGAVDAQLSIVRAEEVITVTVEMMRDGPEDTQVVSAVESIEVGQDQNGKTLTSLVVVPSDASPSGGHQSWPRGLTVFHTALKEGLTSQGEVFQPEPGVLPVRAVEQGVVRNRFYKIYADAEEDEKKRQEKIRKAFNRALGEAQHRGLVKSHRAEEGRLQGRTMLWLPERGDGN
jgi:hypothetical protein